MSFVGRRAIRVLGLYFGFALEFAILFCLCYYYEDIWIR